MDSFQVPKTPLRKENHYTFFSLFLWVDNPKEKYNVNKIFTFKENKRSHVSLSVVTNFLDMIVEKFNKKSKNNALLVTCFIFFTKINYIH